MAKRETGRNAVDAVKDTNADNWHPDGVYWVSHPKGADNDKTIQRPNKKTVNYEKSSCYSIAASMITVGCYEVSTIVRDTQVKMVDMNAPSYVKPLVAELLVKKGIDGESSIRDEWKFNEDDVLSMNGEVEKLKNRAAFLSTQKHLCDVIVSPMFDVYVADGKATVVVNGYPAVYVNFRTMEDSDTTWLQVTSGYRPAPAINSNK